MTFTQTLQKMFKQDLIIQTLNFIYHYLKEKIKKITGSMEDELGGKTMK